MPSTKDALWWDGYEACTGRRNAHASPASGSLAKPQRRETQPPLVAVDVGVGEGPSTGGGGGSSQPALVAADVALGQQGLTASADVLQHDADSQHAALLSADVDVGHDVGLTASLLNFDLVDLHVGLDAGHDHWHA